MAVQRDRADSLQLALKQTLMQVKQEQEARSKADKLVHELWAKLNEVEKEAKLAKNLRLAREERDQSGKGKNRKKQGEE